MKCLVRFSLCWCLVCWSLPVLAEDSYALMLKWLDLEGQKSKLQSEWQARQAILDRRLELLDIEKQAIEEAMARARSATGKVDERRQALLASQQELEREQALLRQQLRGAIGRAEQIQARLPPPVQAQWSERLSKITDDAATDSQKLERLLSMYKLLQEFDDRVALHKAPLRLPSAGAEAQVMVTQIYLGLSQGWYVSEDGQVFGYGRSTPQGWRWWHGDGASEVLGRPLDADALLAVRAMLENPAAAKLIPLPVTTHEG